MAQSEKKTAGSRILWIFAVGQLGWSILANIMSNCFVFFFEPTAEELEKGQQVFIPQGLFFGLTVIGLITAVGRIFDAVTDPFVAGKSDTCRHRLGRRIPFMRYAAVPFGLTAVLLFFPPVQGESGINSVWLFVGTVLFYISMTCYCTPYNALIPELGRTQETRTNLSTFISVTYFFGMGAAYLVPNIAALFYSTAQQEDGTVIVTRAVTDYAGSFRITVAILAVIAVICMLIPAFLIDENVYADTAPSKAGTLASLVKTFKNREFRMFVYSDILYFVALTLFQTGMMFYITVLLGLDKTMSFPLVAGMTFCSFLCYPAVNILAKKLGKKKLIAFAFIFFSFAFLVTGFAGLTPIPPLVYGILIALLAAVPMAILGILPQAVVADIAEADGKETGESRQGMFYAARTFAFKLGQSGAMVLFTSLSRIGGEIGKTEPGYGIGYRITAFLAAALCLLGGIVFMRYNEKKILSQISDNS